jgi:hypothetical protein
MTFKAADILRQAAEVIEQRGVLRDKPDGERSMERAVQAYTTLNGTKMESELDGWLFLCVLKLARATAGKPHLDDLTDLAGYSALAAECLSNEKKTEPDKDGWITWNGGENPVPGKPAFARWRNGKEVYYPFSGFCHWRCLGDDTDVIAYKVIN